MEEVGQNCCEEYKSLEQKYIESRFSKCKKKHFRRGLLIFLSITFSIVICLFCYIRLVVAPIVWEYGESGIEKMLVNSSNIAISSIGITQYDDLTTINYDSSNKITSIVTNSAKVNQLANALAMTTQGEIDKQASLGLKIPIGTCTGITFLVGRGGDITLTVQPHGNILCRFYSTFTSSGINQTLHQVWVSMESEATLVLPFGSKNINKQAEYLVAECVIVGEIPNVYLSGAKFYAN